MKDYVHVSIGGVESSGVRTAKEEACEMGKDCSEEDDPGVLSDGKEKSEYPCHVEQLKVSAALIIWCIYILGINTW